MAEVVFVGYFGFGNLGDELILSAVSEAVRRERPGLALGVLWGPDSVARPDGVECIPRADAAAVRRALGEARVLVVGPGGVFQDATSWRSPLWYAWVCARARARGARVVHVGQSVGPLRTVLGRLATRHALRRSSAVVVRDESSARVCRDLGISERLEVAADAAWLLPSPAQPPVPRARTVALAPRPWPSATVGDARWWAELADELLGAGWEVRGLAMGDADMRLLEEAVRLTGRKWPLARPRDACGALDFLLPCQALIGMRLHALVLGALAGTRLFGVSYDPKVAGLLEALGLEAAGSTEAPPEPARLRELLGGGDWGRVGDGCVQALRERARRNVEAVIEAADVTERAR